MKITKTETLGRYDNIVWLDININDKHVFCIGEDEPEDMTFGRTLNDCLKITNLLKMAYDAGKNGEEFILEELEIKNENSW